MVLMLIERGLPLDEVVFYDTGMEFQAIYDLRDDMLPIFQQHGIKYTTLYPDNPFLYDMLERPVKGRERRGYGWCGGLCRWGTTCKLRTIDQYAERQGAKVYVGIAADETPRLQKERKPYKLFPLAEFGMTEADCLQYCYSAGYFWLEGSIRLYDILDRVSCWCCPLQSLEELRKLYRYFPDLWRQLEEWDESTWRTFIKNYSVRQLAARFVFEAKWQAAGGNIRSKAFHAALRKELSRLGSEVTLCRTSKQKMLSKEQ